MDSENNTETKSTTPAVRLKIGKSVSIIPITEKELFKFINDCLDPLSTEDIKQKRDTVYDAYQNLSKKYPQLDTVDECSSEQIKIIRVEKVTKYSEVKL